MSCSVFLVLFYFGVMPLKINITNCRVKLIIALAQRSRSKIPPLSHTLPSLRGKMSYLILEPMIFGRVLGQWVPFYIMDTVKCSVD